MEKAEKVGFWMKSANEAWEMVDLLFENRKYADALFYGQLYLEKLLKAIYVSRFDSAPPFLHDLRYLAKKCKLDLTEDLARNLEIITGFNINARYDDYKESFRKTATKEYSLVFKRTIWEVGEWLKKQM